MSTESATVARLRADFLAAYDAALARVNGISAVEQGLRTHGAIDLAGELYVLAIGKAAAAMMHGASRYLGERLRRGLVITKHGHLGEAVLDRGRIDCVEASHPVADQSSLDAGTALLAFIDTLPAAAPLLVLVSGGASALVEVLPGGRGADDLARVNEWLLSHALDIGQMNRVRKRISTIKAGRLATRLRGRTVLALLISDVPQDDPKIIGSGLVIPHRAEDLGVSDLDLPGWLVRMTAEAPTLASESDFEQIQVHIVARPADAKAVASEHLRTLGYTVCSHETLLQGDALAAGCTVADWVTSRPGVVHVVSSETTVQLPDRPGRGGRCQSLALCAAIRLAGRPAVVLAAGTDGTDGPGEDAGALVDGGSLARAGIGPAEAADALARADAGSVLASSGDLITTGPTGTNVMDLLLSYAQRL